MSRTYYESTGWPNVHSYSLPHWVFIPRARCRVPRTRGPEPCGSRPTQCIWDAQNAHRPNPDIAKSTCATSKPALCEAGTCISTGHIAVPVRRTLACIPSPLHSPRCPATAILSDEQQQLLHLLVQVRQGPGLRGVECAGVLVKLGPVDFFIPVPVI